jgi:hypothetical protein
MDKPIHTSISTGIRDKTGYVEGFVGMADVGPGAALVLGDETMRTTFFPTEDGGIFARRGYDPGEDEQTWLILIRLTRESD